MRLTSILEKMTKQAIQSLLDEQNKPELGQGAFSTVYASRLNGPICIANRPSELAVSKALDTPYLHIQAARVNNSQKLLRSKRAHSPFIQSLLYHDKEGYKVSPKATMDLSRLIKERHPSLLDSAQLKSIIGQLILGLDALHHHHIVHRDIQPGNILVFIYQGPIQTQFADLDTTLEVNPDLHNAPRHPSHYGRSINYIAAELMPIEHLSDPDEADEKYNQLDLKAVDCAALGKTICELVTPYLEKMNENTSTASPLERLLKKLTDKAPLSRLTIEQAKQDMYFGENKAERDNFFSTLKQAFSRDLFVDNYYCAYPAQGDPFYILPKKLKTIYMLTKKAESLLGYFNADYEHRSAVEIEVAACLVEQAVKEVLENIQEELNKNQDDVLLIEALRELKNELIKKELHNVKSIQRMDAQTLTEVINQVVTHCEKIYRTNISGCVWGFFSGNARKDRLRAEALLKEVKAAIKDNKNTKEILDLLYQYINYDNPNLSPKLKSILSKSLQELSLRPYQVNREMLEMKLSR